MLLRTTIQRLTPFRGIVPSISSIRTFVDKQGIIHSHYNDIQLVERNYTEHIFGCIDGVRRNHGENKIAIECAMSGDKITYDDLYKDIKTYAKGFENLGLKRGDIVMLFMVNGTMLPKLAFALAYLGVTASLANPLFTPYEIEKITQKTKAKAIITQAVFLPNILQGIKDNPHIQVFVDNAIGEDKNTKPLDSVIDDVVVNDDDDLMIDANFNAHETTCFMPFSSGTSGAPKGVMLSHFNMTSAVDIHIDHLNLFEGSDPQEFRKSGMFTILPFFHIYGLMHVMATSLKLGIKLICLPIFDWDLFVNTLREKRPAAISLVPPILSRLAMEPTITKQDLDHLHVITSGGSALPQPIRDQLATKTRPDFILYEGYGMTECSTISRVSNQRKPGIGSLDANVKAKLIDTKSGEIVKPGEAGEICLKAPHVMQGYLNDAEATANTLKNGWLHTGDVGIYDNDGYLFIVDRIKDLIKHKGHQVSPTEVEEVITEIDEVDMVWVVGVKHDTYGEVPKAFIVVKEGEILNEKTVHDVVNEKLSNYKQLRGGIEFVDELPIHPSGKKIRRLLRD